MQPFSEKLGQIKDSKKFMQSISQDMMRTALAREAKIFKNYKDDEKNQLQSRRSSRNSGKRGKANSNSPDLRSEKSGEGSDASNGEHKSKDRVYIHHDPAIKNRTPFT